MRRRDAGSASIETVALVPVVLVVLVLALQVLVMAYTAHAADQAARDAARAYSLDASATQAAAASVPGAVRVVDVVTFGPDHGARVTVEAPPMLFLADRRVSRTVVFP
ncbi:TadE/TadG family type IV pilus assembly protein [Microlunatus capsulatus]|uniref:Flp pilus assembly protein TadG n=1 Tax=Microlunatus capsulatus TaxID=99117 RepID=A0ABS4Z9X3_9ACTN|nr:TadE/TadG family type IV pilus assembly protein [Microlunatus capsulatus]MBP2417522.1 Flp pilus assembly protein TadG [Microlunatus capsulatus]